MATHKAVVPHPPAGEPPDYLPRPGVRYVRPGSSPSKKSPNERCDAPERNLCKLEGGEKANRTTVESTAVAMASKKVNEQQCYFSFHNLFTERNEFLEERC